MAGEKGELYFAGLIIVWRTLTEISWKIMAQIKLELKFASHCIKSYNQNSLVFLRT